MKLFTSFIITSFIVINIYSQSNNNWIRVSTPISAELKRCFFIDTLQGWAAGDSGVIIHTSNGGVTWVLQNYNSAVQISDLQFINTTTGFAIGNDFTSAGSIILKSVNSGANWSSTRFTDTNASLTSIYYLNTSTGFVAGYYGSFYKTTNGGANWTLCNTVPSGFAFYPVLRISFYNAQTGLGCGGRFDFAGVIWSTTDGGLNWNVKDTTAEPQFDIKFFNYPKAYACGGDLEFGGTVSRSSNAGAIWHDSTIGFFGTGRALAFRNISECWIPMGFSGTWMYSPDSANSWSIVPGPDSSGINDALFIDENHGWACGQNGSVFKYVSLIGIKKIEANIPANYELYQNFPNPFNPKTKIKFSIKHNPTSKSGTQVVLRIYDLLGSEVSTLVNEKLQPGTYEAEWPPYGASGFSSGIYFYRLIVKGEEVYFSKTKKMVLLK